MSTLSIDFETRSIIDLRRTGVYPYAQHWSTDVWCMAYSLNGGPVSYWSPFLYSDIGWGTHREMFHDPEMELRAWNAGFEHVIYRDILVPKYGFTTVRTEQ